MKNKYLYMLLLVILLIIMYGSNKKDISILEDGKLRFDHITFGQSVEEIKKLNNEIVTVQQPMLSLGEESAYMREFKSDILAEEVKVYYYMDSSGFQRGEWERFDENKDIYLVNIEMYKGVARTTGDTYGGWPDNIEVCYDGEHENGDYHKEHLQYLDVFFAAAVRREGSGRSYSSW